MTSRSRFVLRQLGFALLLGAPYKRLLLVWGLTTTLLLAAARPAAAQTAGWTTLQRSDLHFSIAFPGDTLPPEFVAQLADPQYSAGHAWPSADRGELVRFIAYDLQDWQSSDAALQAGMLQRLLDEAARRTSEHPIIDAQTPVTLQGFAGLEVRYHDSEWQYRSRIFVVRSCNEVFTTTVTTLPSMPFSADAATFEASLQVVVPAPLPTSNTTALWGQ